RLAVLDDDVEVDLAALVLLLELLLGRAQRLGQSAHRHLAGLTVAELGRHQLLVKLGDALLGEPSGWRWRCGLRHRFGRGWFGGRWLGWGLADGRRLGFG